MHNRNWEEKWEILGSPKSGGHSKVTKVRNRKDNSIGALKELSLQYMGDSDRRKRMAREVLALGKLDGASVPSILDHNMQFKEESDVPLYFVESWIEGITLSEYVQDSPKAINEAIRFTKLLAETLNLCHQKGIVHRDIKPDNIIITKNSEAIPVLVDFGSAYVQGADELNILTENSQELGNRFFRLSDHAAGSLIKRGERSDVTLLAGVFFYLLTGKYPRVLRDENGLPPHEASTNLFPEATINDTRWDKMMRLFKVAFSLPINDRIQSSVQLIGYLNDLTAQKKTDSNYLQIELERLKQLTERESIATRQLIDKSLKEVSDKLQVRLRDLTQNSNLIIHRGGLNPIQSGSYAEMIFGISLDNTYAVKAELINRINVFENKITAGFQILPNFEMKYYYEGPRADTGQLEEEVLNHADVMFADLVKRLNQQLSVTSN